MLHSLESSRRGYLVKLGGVRGGMGGAERRARTTRAGATKKLDDQT